MLNKPPLEEEETEAEEPKTLYSITGCSLLLRYPMLNIKLDEALMLKYSWNIYTNSALMYDVWMVSKLFTYHINFFLIFR